MLYSLEMGQDDEKFLLQQAQRNRRPIPERIANAPFLFQGLELYLQAFMELTSCRGLGYGSIGPIPWLSIQTYCEVYDIVDEQREDLFYHVQRLDKVYMEWQRDKAAAEQKKAAEQAKAKASKRGTR